MTDNWLRVAIESAPDCILIVDKNRKINFVNQRTETLFGYKSHELIGAEVELLVGDELKAKHRELHTAYTAAPVARPMGLARPLLARHKDGHMVPVEISLSPSRIADDQFIVAIVRDISERQRMEQILKESRETFGTFFEMSPSGVALVSKRDAFIRFNGAFLNLLGYSTEAELMRHPFSEIVHPEDLVRLYGQMETLTLTSGPQETEVRVQRANGATLWLRLSLCLIDSQNPVYFITCMDISAQKNAENLLIIKAKGLEASNQKLEEFASIASHDLRAPARRAATLLQLLNQQHAAKLDEEGQKALSFAITEVQRLQDTVRDLLEYSQVCASPLTFSSCSLNAIVEAVSETLKPEIERRGAHVTCGPLPQVRGNEPQLRRLFSNLFSNALKFNQGKPRIEVFASQAEGKPSVTVRDNGVGIGEAELERVFTIFYRGHSDSEFPGTGVGLASCKRIMENHGGTISVRSRPGQGSEFTVTFPSP